MPPKTLAEQLADALYKGMDKADGKEDGVLHKTQSVAYIAATMLEIAQSKDLTPDKKQWMTSYLSELQKFTLLQVTASDDSMPHFKMLPVSAQAGTVDHAQAYGNALIDRMDAADGKKDGVLHRTPGLKFLQNEITTTNADKTLQTDEKTARLSTLKEMLTEITALSAPWKVTAKDELYIDDAPAAPAKRPAPSTNLSPAKRPAPTRKP